MCVYKNDKYLDGEKTEPPPLPPDELRKGGRKRRKGMKREKKRLVDHTCVMLCVCVCKNGDGRK